MSNELDTRYQLKLISSTYVFCCDGMIDGTIIRSFIHPDISSE